MPQNNGPRAPKPERLEELIDLITGWKFQHANPGETPTQEDKCHDQQLDEIVEALDWTHTMLTNRRGHQLKQQMKKKGYETWAKTNLSPDELAEIDRQAEENANRELMRKENNRG